jgi:lysophospholipase L1-like esterase
MSELTFAQESFIVQFFHPEKSYPNNPGMNETVAAALNGVELATYQKIKSHFGEEARRAARELLADPAFAVSVERLPFTPGSTVVGLGDSITDDYQSWLEILRYLLEFQRPQDQITVVNAGISGDTTAEMFARFLEIAQQQPQWIICLAGGNDARMHGLHPTNTLVSPQESAKNLAMLRNFAATQTTAQWVWMTPTLCLEEQIAVHWFLSSLQLSWSKQALCAIADFMRQQPDPVVDLRAIFGDPPQQDLLIEDGLHPSLKGQMLIVRSLVERLAP